MIRGGTRGPSACLRMTIDDSNIHDSPTTRSPPVPVLPARGTGAGMAPSATPRPSKHTSRSRRRTPRSRRITPRSRRITTEPRCITTEPRRITPRSRCITTESRCITAESLGTGDNSAHRRFQCDSRGGCFRPRGAWRLRAPAGASNIWIPNLPSCGSCFGSSGGEGRIVMCGFRSQGGHCPPR
jgi:hypothetical protein